MKIIETAIPDVVVIEPTVFSDQRGYFFESWQRRRYADAGLCYDFIQDNQSCSCYGTIRGLHFQKGKWSQAKLVRVLFGEVLDVAVDLREGSSSFGRHVGVILSGENNRQLMIPRGFAHGFSVLSEKAVFAYKCDNDYCKESESGIRFNDPDLAIDWKIPADQAILSDKDQLLPLLKDYVPCF